MRGYVAGAAALALAAGPAVAETTSQILFQHKHWEVEYVQFDDGAVACLAEVDAQTDSFTIWYYQDGTFRLQFYSTSWQFGDPGSTADLQVVVDRRAPWSLTGADLYKNSVLFNIPDSDAGVEFLVEISQGNTLYLNTADGRGVMNYSLQGSRASMDALIECGNAITSNRGNPFN
jgi:hypothetical protein